MLRRWGMMAGKSSILLGVITVTATVGAALPARAQECTPPRMMVVLDKSSSMQTGVISGQTKWSIAADALDTVATEFQSSIELGLMMFPSPNQCSPGSMFVEPALGTRDAIIASLGSPPPTGGNYTPMSQTLESAALEPSLLDSSLPRYAVLITDGWQWCSPYDPSTRFDAVDAVAGLSSVGVQTFVVGFGAGVDALLLNSLAVEAGTARGGCNPAGNTPTAANPCYYQADDPGQLIGALMEIASSVSQETCDGEDNDCDGEVDENLTRPCLTDCGVGLETCDNGNWIGCTAPTPEPETCDGQDNDCNGTIDPGCDCAAGESRSCGPDDACEPGTQSCGTDGTWGDCEGAVDSGPESCDGEDNDCDGLTDEAAAGDDDVALGLCPPGFVCEGGGCDPVDPEPPTPDDDDDGFGADGDTGVHAGSCACNSGSMSNQSLLGTLFLAFIAGMFLRHQRRSKRPTNETTSAAKVPTLDQLQASIDQGATQFELEKAETSFYRGGRTWRRARTQN